MKSILSALILVLSLGVAISGFTEEKPWQKYSKNNLIGTWQDKTYPRYQYKFLETHDFIYSTTYTDEGVKRSSLKNGVWEIGEWNVTSRKNIKSTTCNLTIYAGTKECCFEYKFIANNLILTNKYKSDPREAMCENRVLIREK
jgi:hypothetical protein